MKWSRKRLDLCQSGKLGGGEPACFERVDVAEVGIDQWSLSLQQSRKIAPSLREALLHDLPLSHFGGGLSLRVSKAMICAASQPTFVTGQFGPPVTIASRRDLAPD